MGASDHRLLLSSGPLDAAYANFVVDTVVARTSAARPNTRDRDATAAARAAADPEPHATLGCPERGASLPSMRWQLMTRSQLVRGTELPVLALSPHVIAHGNLP